MRTKHTPVYLVFLILSLLILAACERPVPRDVPEETPTTEAPAIQPEVLPEQPVPTLAGDVVPIATVDPALATPIPLVTEEPAVDTLHTVQPGETLGTIAAQYGISVEEIAIANNISDVNVLEVNQELIIPAPGTIDISPTLEPTAADTTLSPTEAPSIEPTSAAGGTHVVQAGENLFRISLKYGCTVDQMAAHNGIVNPAQIAVGQVLQIPECK